jgi:adenosylcobyric acid synthase
MESFAVVGEGVDIVLVEGAGSPAEVNLRAGDIANMGFAEAADLPVVLLGDIDRGGVIASLVGTHAVLSESDRLMIKTFLVNKFRGDIKVFDGGLAAVTERTGWPCHGVIPWFGDARLLPAEDVLGLAAVPGEPTGKLIVAVPKLARIANFDDLDPLRMEPEVSVVLVEPGSPIPVEAGLILIPGSKSTIADLAFLRAQGWDIDILAHRRRGGRVLGLCGGYQMLGRSIADPGGIEGPTGRVDGLGLLNIDTVLSGDKTTVAARGRHVMSGEPIAGYEIHLGRTDGPDTARPMLDLGGRPDGAIAADGMVAGSYVHGIFSSDDFRRAFLSDLGAKSTARYEARVEATLDDLARHLEAHVDIDALLILAGLTDRPGASAMPAARQ